MERCIVNSLTTRPSHDPLLYPKPIPIPVKLQRESARIMHHCYSHISYKVAQWRKYVIGNNYGQEENHVRPTPTPAESLR